MLTLSILLGASLVQAATLAPDDEQQILAMVNRERQSRGLSALVLNEDLRDAARRHSERMASANMIGHQLEGEPTFDRRLVRAEPFDTSGENVAVASDAARAHSALMHSPKHRANILDREYNSIGIGVVRRGGEIFVTQDFARLVPNSSVNEMEQQVVSTLTQEHRGTRRVAAPELRRRACEMASRDRLNPSAGLLPGANGSLVFTALNPAEIPGQLRSLRGRAAGSFSVGACYRSSASYDSPVYWIIVVTYSESPRRTVSTADY